MSYAGIRLVSGPLTLDPSLDDYLILYDATASDNHHIAFPAVASLPSGFRVTVKKIDCHSNQIPIISAVGERVDLFYSERRLVQSQEARHLACFVDADGMGQIITTAAMLNDGHRTVAIPAYNVAAGDCGPGRTIVHKCCPNGLPGNVQNLNLPPLSQITGTNPDGTPSYITPRFHFKLCTPGIAQIFPFGGEYANGNKDRLIITNLYEEIVMDAHGDMWRAGRIAAA